MSAEILSFAAARRAKERGGYISAQERRFLVDRLHRQRDDDAPPGGHAA